MLIDRTDEELNAEVDEYLRDLEHPLKDGLVAVRNAILLLVFHRGAKVRPDGDEFIFDDHKGLLKRITCDQATLTLADLDDVHAKLPASSTLSIAGCARRRGLDW